MVDKLKGLLVKYREQWSYLIVGGCTTVINYVIYFGLNHLGVHYLVSQVVSWVGAVTFAYFANGAFVYTTSSKRSVKEAAAFVASRLFSLGLETVLLILLVELVHMNENIAKLLVAVVTVVVNYLTGKLVYRQKGER